MDNFIALLGSRERQLLHDGLSRRLKESSVAQDEEAVAEHSPTLDQLQLVFLHQMLPFVGFGFLDNLIMILAGEYLDVTIGVTLGISVQRQQAWNAPRFSCLALRSPSLPPSLFPYVADDGRRGSGQRAVGRGRHRLRLVRGEAGGARRRAPPQPLQSADRHDFDESGDAVGPRDRHPDRLFGRHVPAPLHAQPAIRGEAGASGRCCRHRYPLTCSSLPLSSSCSCPSSCSCSSARLWDAVQAAWLESKRAAVRPVV